MKFWKRFGAALIAAVALTAALTGTALAAEPVQKGIDVQLNGQNLTFTDAAPEITGDRTFLPFRAVLEAMGAQVDYDSQTKTVSAQREGVTMSMVPGQKAMTVTEGGQTRTVEMDVAPYINTSNGRTYLPIRYAAEVLGYTVGWDGSSRTVIIVDVDALFGSATFQLMENFAAYCDKQQSKLDNMAVTGKLDIEITDKSGELGGKPIKIGGSIDGVAGEKGAQLTGQLSLAGLADLAGMSAGSPLEQAMIQAMLETLSGLSAELRVDLEKNMLYISLPAELTGAAQDTWYSVDFNAYQAELLGALDMTQIAQLEGAGIRESLVWVLENLPLDDAEMSYATLAELAEIYTDMLSDQAFTKSGNTHKAKFTLEDMVNLEITLTQRGQDIVAIDLSMSADVEETGAAMKMTMAEHAAPDTVTIHMSLDMKDTEMDIRFDFDLSCVPTQKAPVVTPPAGSQVVPMD